MAGLFVLTTRKGSTATTHQVLAFLLVLLLAAACGSAPVLPAELSSSSDSIELSGVVGGSASGSFSVHNPGRVSVQYRVSSNASWLSVSKGSEGELGSEGSADVELLGQCPSRAGSYDTLLTVQAQNHPNLSRMVAVRMLCSLSISPGGDNTESDGNSGNNDGADGGHNHGSDDGSNGSDDGKGNGSNNGGNDSNNSGDDGDTGSDRDAGETSGDSSTDGDGDANSGSGTGDEAGADETTTPRDEGSNQDGSNQNGESNQGGNDTEGDQVTSGFPGMGWGVGGNPEDKVAGDFPGRGRGF